VHDSRRLSFAVALRGAPTALAAAGIDCRVASVVPDLPPEADGVLAWAVREAETNVVRHSGARTCAITVSARVIEQARGKLRRATRADDIKAPLDAAVERFGRLDLAFNNELRVVASRATRNAIACGRRIILVWWGARSAPSLERDHQRRVRRASAGAERPGSRTPGASVRPSGANCRARPLRLPI